MQHLPDGVQGERSASVSSQRPENAPCSDQDQEEVCNSAVVFATRLLVLMFDVTVEAMCAFGSYEGGGPLKKSPSQLTCALAAVQVEFLRRCSMRRSSRLFRTEAEKKSAREFEAPRSLVSRIIRTAMLKRTAVSRGRGEGSGPGSKFHRLEIPLVLQAGIRSLLWDLTVKSGPLKFGMQEVFLWQIGVGQLEELDQLCSFHDLRLGKKKGYYSAVMRQNGKVMVKIVPPVQIEHRTNHDDISSLVMTFYTLEINRCGAVHWPTNLQLYATQEEFTTVETNAWALLQSFALDNRGPSGMHSDFIRMANRRRVRRITRFNADEVPDSPGTVQIDESETSSDEDQG